MKTVNVRIYSSSLFYLTALLLTGCSGVFFYPSSVQFVTPKNLGLPYEDVVLSSEDDVTLHGWFLPALVAPGEPSKGTIYYLHGNAENISTHILNVWWLPAQGYHVFMLDYRGFGRSTGSPDVEGAINDIRAGHDWLEAKLKQDSGDIFLLGQSLGASLAIYYAATQQRNNEKRFSGVISDAAFTGYSDIARHVASKSWLTWLFQYPLSWIVIRGYDPVQYVGSISPIPLLIIHSRDDRIIPYEYGTQLYAAANSPKRFFATEGAHTATFQHEKGRLALIAFLRQSSRQNASIP